MTDGRPVTTLPLPSEQDASLGYQSSSPHASGVRDAVQASVGDGLLPKLARPSVLTATALEAEADPPEMVRNRRIVDADADGSYRDGVNGHELLAERQSVTTTAETSPACQSESGDCRSASSEHARHSRLSRWQEQR